MRDGRLWTVLCLAAVGAALAGCAGPQQQDVRPGSATPPRPVADVDVVDLQAMPTAMNWDDVSGPDGLQARVFLFRQDRAQPVVGEGRLVFSMFEGRVPVTALAVAEPAERWAFEGDALRARLGRNIVGWGYAFVLPWRRVPPSAAVTLVAHYEPPGGGRPVRSAPLTVAVRVP